MCSLTVGRIVTGTGYGGAMSPSEPPTEPPRKWTFLSNHGHVLVALSRDPQARIRDLAASVGITERAAQAIVNDLEADGYVTKVRVGRRNEYHLHPDMHFRHPAEDTQPIGALLKIFAGARAARGDRTTD